VNGDGRVVASRLAVLEHIGGERPLHRFGDVALRHAGLTWLVPMPGEELRLPMRPISDDDVAKLLVSDDDVMKRGTAALVAGPALDIAGMARAGMLNALRREQEQRQMLARLRGEKVEPKSAEVGQ
jgi:hypothetical protein